MGQKISQKTIDAAINRRDAAVAAGQIGYRERIADIGPGLTLEITARGTSWRRDYRPRGLTPEGKRLPGRVVIIGDVMSHSPDDARREAAEIGRLVAEGRDPATERRAEIASRLAERAAQRPVAELVEEWAADLAKRPSSRRAGQMTTSAHVSHQTGMVRRALIDMKLQAISPSDIPAAPFKARYRNAMGSTQRHEHGALDRYFGWLVEQGLAPANPLADISMPKAGASRERVLTPEELAAVWHGAEKLVPVYADFVRFLIALPARRGEVSMMRWADIQGGYWVQSQTKNGQPHRLLITPTAEAIVERRQAARSNASDLVFPAPRSSDVITGWSKLLGHIHAASGTRGWSLHDLRRSVVTHLAEARDDLSLADVDAVLNHATSATKGGVLGVYQKAQRQGAQDRVVRAWDEVLTGIIADRAAA